MQLTALVLMSNGAHLIVNNKGAPWNAFRKVVKQVVVDYMEKDKDAGLHVACAAVAHIDHFHLIEDQAELFEVLGSSDSIGPEEQLDEQDARGTCH